MTTSPLLAPLGVQEPRLHSVPPAAVSAGDEAIEIARRAGLVLDPWQQLVLRGALGESAGKHAAFEVCVVVPRQNGKGSILEALELWALFFPEPGAPPPLILHSAHEFKTSAEHFRRMRDLIELNPHLKKQVRIIRTAAGSEAIELHSGARLRFVTRTGGSGRGFSADMIVIDEAYNLTADSMAAVLPTMSARPNPQVWYTSSAGMVGSEQLARLRERGSKSGDPRLAYFEWSAPDDANLDDRQAWRQANPALGIRIPESFVESERLALPDEQFARERLGIWPTVAKRDAAVDLALWNTLIAPAPPWGSQIAFSLDIAPDHSTATIAAAWVTAEGPIWVQLADHRPGVEWVPDRCAALLAKYDGKLLVEQTGTAAFLLPRLEADGVPRRFFADACSTLDAAVQSRTLRHGNQPELNAALSVARWSTSGEAGQRVLSRKNSQVSPVVAVALALHAAAAKSIPEPFMVVT